MRVVLDDTRNRAEGGPDASPPGGAFATKLRTRRRALGLSQAQLAAGAFDPSYISLLEAGKRQPTGAALHSLATRLDCEPNDLAVPAARVARPEPEPSSTPNRSGAAGTTSPEIADALRQIQRGVCLSRAEQHTGAAAAYASANQRLQHLTQARAVPATIKDSAAQDAYRRQLAGAWRDLADAQLAAGLVDVAVAGWRQALMLMLGPALPAGDAPPPASTPAT
jgi:transcriptional regulator with XRE-family HTH domain